MNHIFDCHRADYDAMDGLNQSRLKNLLVSPLMFKFQLAAKHEMTPALALGCLLEHLVLGTPFAFVESKFETFNTTAAKEWRSECEAKGLYVFKRPVIDTANVMADIVREFGEFKKRSASLRCNIGLQGRHEPTGTPMKGLLDFAPNDELVIFDIKTCRDASVHGFGKSIAEFGYSIQAAWYRELWRQNFQQDRDFCFICIESEAPHHISSQMLPKGDIDAAWSKCEELLEIYSRCTQQNKWEGYPSQTVWAEVPKWALRGAMPAAIL